MKNTKNTKNTMNNQAQFKAQFKKFDLQSVKIVITRNDNEMRIFKNGICQMESKSYEVASAAARNIFNTIMNMECNQCNRIIINASWLSSPLPPPPSSHCHDCPFDSTDCVYCRTCPYNS